MNSGLDWYTIFGFVNQIIYSCVVLALLIYAFTKVSRYGRAAKWLAFGLLILLVTNIINDAVTYIVPRIFDPPTIMIVFSLNFFVTGMVSLVGLACMTRAVFIDREKTTDESSNMGTIDNDNPYASS